MFERMEFTGCRACKSWVGYSLEGFEIQLAGNHEKLRKRCLYSETSISH